jgi:hypothetical protein
MKAKISRRGTMKHLQVVPLSEGLITGSMPIVRESEVPNVQGVCKDCNNGTLNNELNPAFNVEYAQFDGDVELVISCLQCGSEHVDVL